MTRLYLLRESVALERFPRLAGHYPDATYPTRSFFVSDDLFLSEADADDFSSPGYISFSSAAECQPFTRTFLLLRRIVEDKVITETDISNLEELVGQAVIPLTL